jgi:hypothetical protein
VKFAIAIAAALVFSCTRAPKDKTPAERQPEGFALPSSGPLVLIASDDGTFLPHGSKERVLRPFPLARAPMAVQPLGDGAIVAVNRVGLKELTVVHGSTGAAVADTPWWAVVRRVAGAEAEFAGRTVSSSWSRDGQAYFLLFRHPVYELEAPRSPPSVIILASAAGAATKEPGLGADAYAVFPVSPEAWLVQRRYETEDRVITEYASVDPAAGTEKALSRAAFEKLASPLPLTAAPESIRAAADTLAGPLLIEARLPGGSRKTYARGDPGEAAPAWGHELVTSDGISVSLLVTDDWRIALARFVSGGYTVSAMNPAPPFTEARVRDAVMVNGAIVIAWEEAIFPDIGYCGLAILKPGL